MIACKRIAKKYGDGTVLTDVTMRLEPRECVCILGAAGSGKTTLFRLLLCQEAPSGGSIEIDGVDLRDLPPLILQLYRSRLGIVFQEPQLLEHHTVAENLAYPLEIQGLPAAQIAKRVGNVLQKLSLTPKAKYLPAALSQSERALTGIARALVGNPMIILADEPLQLLDEAQAAVVLEMFKDACAQGVTVVAFSSNPAISDALGGRTLTLEKGRIAEAASSRAVAKALDPHRILETNDAPPTTTNITKPVPSESKGGKIKITSIGS